LPRAEEVRSSGRVIPVRILGTASVFPGRPLTTAEIAARAVPPLDPEVTLAKTGIATRHFADPGTKIADLAAQALRGAAEAAGIDVRDLRRVILATSEGGDILGPATANATIHALGLDNRCDGFDVVNACMGFLSAFDLGARSVATGVGPVGVVASEILSRALRPDWRRPWVVFGDAASAVILGTGRPGEGILGVHLGNDGSLDRTVYAEHPLLTHEMEWLKMNLSSDQMQDIVLRVLHESAQAVLGPAGETMDSVDWVLPHQPNGAMLQTIVEVLGVPPGKVVPVVQDIGSVVAASIPASLDRLLRTRRVAPGARILMIGVGSGIAYGAALYRVAPEA
jgi:3-oxoacyl-(acyl-carrier-protein) synthase III